MFTISTDWPAKAAEVDTKITEQRTKLQAATRARDDLAFAAVSGDRDALRQTERLDADIAMAERNMQRLVTARDAIEVQIAKKQQTLAEKAEQDRLGRIRAAAENAQTIAHKIDDAMDELCRRLADLRTINESIFHQVGDISSTHPLAEFQAAVPIVLQERIAKTGWARRTVIDLMEDRLSLAGWYPSAERLAERAAQIGSQQPISVAAE